MRRPFLGLVTLLYFSHALDLQHSSSSRKVYEQILSRNSTDQFFMQLFLGSNDQGTSNSTFIIDISEHHTMTSSTFSKPYGCKHQYYDEQSSNTAVNVSKSLITHEYGQGSIQGYNITDKACLVQDQICGDFSIDQMAFLAIEYVSDQ